MKVRFILNESHLLLFFEIQKLVYLNSLSFSRFCSETNNLFRIVAVSPVMVRSIKNFKINTLLVFVLQYSKKR